MKNVIREQKAGIVSGVVASAIFIYFIQPILNFFSLVFVASSQFIGDAYIDRIYQQASHLETQDYSFLLIMLLLGAFSFALAGISVKLFLIVLRKKKRQDEPTQDKEKNPRSRTTVRAISVAFIFQLQSILMLSIVVANYIQLSVISSFKQHVRILAPYISDLEEEKFISEWSLMNSKGDYQQIYRRLNIIASANKIQLPENKIYSILSL